MLQHHRKTLENIFLDPPSNEILWESVEKMLYASSANVSYSDNNRIRLLLGGCVAIFHRGKVEKFVSSQVVLDLREFLIKAGVRR